MPDPAENADARGSNNRNGETVTVSKTAKWSLWLMGLSIILVLYVHTSLAIPDSTTFNITFLVGALASLAMIPMMIIMRRRAISKGNAFK